MSPDSSRMIKLHHAVGIYSENTEQCVCVSVTVKYVKRPHTVSHRHTDTPTQSTHTTPTAHTVTEAQPQRTGHTAGHTTNFIERIDRCTLSTLYVSR